MRSQINLGSVFGIKIGLHYSWFIIAFLIVLSLSAQFHARNPAWGEGLILALAVLTAILFFVSLLLHELAHSLVAKSRGIPVREITLFALGGVSQIETEPDQREDGILDGDRGTVDECRHRSVLSGVEWSGRRACEPGHSHGFMARLHQSDAGCL